MNRFLKSLFGNNDAKSETKVTGDEALESTTSNRDDIQQFSVALEALVSAGPRKMSVSEYEADGGGADLCEDGAGVLLKGDGAYFWLADGASNGPVIIPSYHSEYEPEGDKTQTNFRYPTLSARILSQDLGRVFTDLLSECNETEIEFLSADFRNKAAERIIELWDDRFRRFLKAHSAEELDAVAQKLPTYRDGGYVLDWSSTFLAGRLSYAHGKNILQVCNFGDCSGLIVTKERSVLECSPQKSRIFMRCVIGRGTLSPESSIKFQLTLKEEPGTQSNYENVSCFMFSSDGFAKGGAASLRKIAEKIIQDGDQVERKFRDIARNYLGKEYDDKALVIGRVAQSGGVHAG